MDITNPRRILAVSLESSTLDLVRVIKDLTGSRPEAASTSLAGTSHDLPLKTNYYTATVPIWLDLIASPEEWAESFLSEEARQVLAVLGGVLLVFSIPKVSPRGEGTGANLKDKDKDENKDEDVDDVHSLIRHVGRVVQKGLGGWEWDGVRLAVGVGEGEAEEWDELCAEAGFEFVQVGGAQKELNEFGEKTGIPRVREALESNDWAQLDDEEQRHEEEFSGGSGSDFGDFKGGSDDKDKHGAEMDVEKLGFGFDRADFEGLKKAIWESGQDGALDDGDEVGEGRDVDADESRNTKGEDENKDLDEDDIAKVENMMRRLQAAREMGEGMSEAQRRRLAARAVEEVMQDL